MAKVAIISYAEDEYDIDEVEEASKIIDDSDQIRVLYNRNIEPFNIAEDKND